ncbi:MAG: pilus assembly protein PilP [Pseudomonadota bacterium]
MYKLTACLALSLALVGCGGDNFEDLRQYTDQIKARPPGKISPLPEIKAQEPFLYSATQLRDPFTPSVQETAPSSSGKGIQPDPNHIKEPLEAYPLDTLRMVGTFELGSNKWSLIKAPDGAVYRVQPGNYLGQNYGKILRLWDDSIELVEIIEDGQGGWMERAASLALSEESTEGGKP